VGPEAEADADSDAISSPFEGLRERKKRLTRQLISDVATEMFLERGFDDVKVTEVASRCAVSEKTVYNYFPTKESLLLDREEDMGRAIRAALGPGAPARSPIQAAVEVLHRQLEDFRPHWGNGTDQPVRLGRFFELIESTPSLRAAQRDMMDRLVQVAAEAMADRAGVSPDDPEPQIAATAIVGLWRIQFQAMRLLSTSPHTFDEIQGQVTAEVVRAARLIDSGLWAFEVMVQGRGTREQMKAAADAAQNAGRQVVSALKDARNVWRQVTAEHRQSHPAHGVGPSDVHRQHLGGGARRSLQKELAEWKAAQRELKQQYVKAKHEQQQVLREALRQQQKQARRGG
jgi:AcrR family transcriptional regulator